MAAFDNETAKAAQRICDYGFECCHQYETLMNEGHVSNIIEEAIGEVRELMEVRIQWLIRPDTWVKQDDGDSARWHAGSNCVRPVGANNWEDAIDHAIDLESHPMNIQPALHIEKPKLPEGRIIKESQNPDA